MYANRQSTREAYFAQPVLAQKNDWIGVGVEPDVKTSAADAVQTTQELAFRNLQPKSISSERFPAAYSQCPGSASPVSQVPRP